MNNKDHRDLAINLNLYIQNKEDQGLPLLLENFVFIRNKLQNFIREKWQKYCFKEVITPILGGENLYKTSGHLQHYKNDMFPPCIREQKNKSEIYYLRPMTCPHHCLIYNSKPRSYSELPFRLSENSFLFRYENSGSLKGLERNRTLELADQHIFVNFEKLKEELKYNIKFIEEILGELNFNIFQFTCSTYDPKDIVKYHNDNEIWQKSESLLLETLKELNINYIIEKGAAAFYGPKLDIETKNWENKLITIATIQLDFLLPIKFKLNYLDQEKKKQIPILIHQSPIGSYQRFIALLLEQKGGRLPLWLAPLQLALLPINDKEETINFCNEIKQTLTNNRIKIIDKKTIKYRIHQIYEKKIPYYCVIGLKELDSKIVKLVFTYENTSRIIHVNELANHIK